MGHAFNPFSKKDWDKAGRDIQHGFENLGHEAQHTADKATKPISDALSKARHEIERGLNDARHQIEKGVTNGLHKVQHGVTDGVHRLDKGVTDAVHQVEHTAQDALHKVESTIEHGLHQLESEIQHHLLDPVVRTFTHLGQEAFHELKRIGHDLERLPGELAGAVMSDLGKHFLKLVLKEVLDVIEEIVPDELPLQFGPFVLYINRVDEKIGALESWAEHSPDFSKRSTVIEMVKVLSPFNVGLDFNAEFSFFLIASKDAGIDIQLRYDVVNDTEKMLQVLSRLKHW